MKAQPTNWKELIAMAKEMPSSKRPQRDLREKFGDVRGQKLFYLLLLDKEFPNCKLLELDDRSIMKLHFAKLIKLGNRVEKLERIQREDAIEGRAITQPLKEEEFQAWILEQIEKPGRPDRAS